MTTFALPALYCTCGKSAAADLVIRGELGGMLLHGTCACGKPLSRWLPRKFIPGASVPPAAGDCGEAGRDGDGSAAEDEIECDGDGEFEVHMNASYLLDVLAALDAGHVKMTVKDAASPVLLVSPGRLDRLAVVMPQRR